ncbi:MAG: type IV pili methyl-accepting chemotaxis transducer N-terminal domain-containing protein [Steroidobacteraceae bacterium]
MNAIGSRWTLGAKLAAVGLPFLLLGLFAIAISLWVSWQLDGGAAAVNEAGRMRMQAYRLAWVSSLDRPAQAREELLGRFDRSLVLLADGDPERPLVTPWDDEVRTSYAAVQKAWTSLRALHHSGTRADVASMDRATSETVDAIDGLVEAIEKHLARYINILHFLQLSMLVVGTIAASVLVVVGYHFVLEPVVGLKRAVSQLRAGDLSARVEPSTSDELGELAAGFNDMARKLQASYSDLEQRVREKTAELQDERERLQALYDVSLLVARGATLQALAEGFTSRVRLAAHADAAALRWADEGREQFLLLAAEGLPDEMARDEHCIRAGDCHCGQMRPDGGTRVIPIRQLSSQRRMYCEHAGWATIVAVPIHAQDRMIGELDLFFHAEVTLSEAEHTLLETLTSHLASGMENLRLHALEREAAVAEERTFLARELHDSIAQSLAFLNIQAQLMRKAVAEGDRERMVQVMAEIELGLKESHGDVRELLVHFRTRTNAQDMEHALQATLRKFEHQSGLSSSLTMHDQGMPLAPDAQVQALHIVQEALSNVRKHAHASHVRIDVWKRPAWRIEVRDDGRGFDRAASAGDEENHVGLRIMRERAHRLGAALEVISTPGQGTTVVLQLPARAEADVAAAPTLEATSGPALSL